MDERRASPRCRPSRTTLGRVLVTPSDASLAAVLQDVSTSGIGLLVRSAVEPESLLCIDLPDTDPFLARVARVTPQPDGTWVLGCRLLDPPAPDLQATLS